MNKPVSYSEDNSVLVREIKKILEQQPTRPADSQLEARITRFNPAIVPPDERDCARCEDDIPAARLAAMPIARYCRECQEVIDLKPPP